MSYQDVYEKVVRKKMVNHARKNRNPVTFWNENVLLPVHSRNDIYLSKTYATTNMQKLHLDSKG